jgi:hypothetical protein
MYLTQRSFDGHVYHEMRKRIEETHFLVPIPQLSGSRGVRDGLRVETNVACLISAYNQWGDKTTTTKQYHGSAAAERLRVGERGKLESKFGRLWLPLMGRRLPSFW